MSSYWDNLFREREAELPPERWLSEDIMFFKPGKLLDIGAGDGRNSFYFNDSGFEVTCLDASEPGIEKIKGKAAANRVRIKTIVADVCMHDISPLSGRYDTVTMIHFFPDRNVFDRITQLVTAGGIIYCMTFINDDYPPESPGYEIGISSPEIEHIKRKYNLIRDGIRTDSRGDFYYFLARVN